MRTTKTARPHGPKTTGVHGGDFNKSLTQTPWALTATATLTTMGVGFRIFRGSAYTRVPVSSVGTNAKEQGQ